MKDKQHVEIWYFTLLWWRRWKLWGCKSIS